MATYSITDNPNPHGKTENEFKYRHRSSSAEPTAQAAFDELKRTWKRGFLWAWVDNHPTLIDEFHNDR